MVSLKVELQKMKKRTVHSFDHLTLFILKPVTRIEMPLDLVCNESFIAFTSISALAQLQKGSTSPF